ncbi:MAG TPA: FAD-binding protein, partial [Bacteroidia bacterium]|nr:FAD-binding protein [Bacteroidia bacterium]
MSVLVYIENVEGKFKKSAFEVLSFGAAIAAHMKLPLVALSIGDVSDDELSKTGLYGATKVLKASGDNLKAMNVQPYTSVVTQAAKAEGSKVVVMSASFSGKAIAPRVAIKLNAGLGENVIDLPEMTSGFVVKKGAYSGKAFAFVEILSDIKVISMMPNSYKVVENADQVNIVPFAATVEANDLKLVVKETIRSSDKVSLPDAELVVSAGRGMKGPENWGMIEELAQILGAATA